MDPSLRLVRELVKCHLEILIELHFLAQFILHTFIARAYTLTDINSFLIRSSPVKYPDVLLSVAGRVGINTAAAKSACDLFQTIQ